MERESERSLLTLPDPSPPAPAATAVEAAPDPSGPARDEASERADDSPDKPAKSDGASAPSPTRMTGKPVMRKPDPDLELVERSRQGDTRAFDELVGKYSQKLYGLV